MSAREQPHVLVLSRAYPNAALPTQGLWVERMVRAAQATARVTVVAPVPYVPSFLAAAPFARYRRVPAEESTPVAVVHHPRMLTGPGQWLHALDARFMSLGIAALVRMLHQRDPIDLIHAHFVYPEGVAAARLNEHLGIPVITTEHAHWMPWMRRHGRVRRQVLAALPRIRLVTGVSPSVCEGIEAVAGRGVGIEWLPNVLDEVVFSLRERRDEVDPDQLLFVGVVRRVKGLDILVRALATLVRRLPRIRLRVIGEPFHRAYRRDELAVRRLVEHLGLRDRVDFVGQASPVEVAAAMRRAAAVVVPSRRESFSSVTMEALASGTPVVATRCGGPEHIIAQGMGHVVPPEDPHALADAIADIVTSPGTRDPMAMRQHVVRQFGFDRAQRRLTELYSRAMARGDGHSGREDVNPGNVLRHRGGGQELSR